MRIEVYNTMARQKETLVPLSPGHVRMYVCGPTVYDLSHIGHARVYVVFDTIARFLRRHYKVTYARNFTDVDDKIIKRAQATGETPILLAERFIKEFEADMNVLGCEPVDAAPKVTDHIGEIVALAQELIAKGAAYEAQGDVYYAVERFAAYGQLGRRSLEDMEAGARVEVSAIKRHPMDFVLWKAAKPGEICWDSPWGKGRPGWHIECSAMSRKLLGQSFDIHGGGRDLIFPHHENEIAQSEGAHGQTYARYWLHNGLVNIDNEKMSKSLGNFFTIRQVLDKFDPQTIRFYLLCTHYRSPINFSDVALREAETRLRYFYETLAALGQALANDKEPGASTAGSVRDDYVLGILERFDAAMSDDFNTPLCIGDLSDVFKVTNDVIKHPGDAAEDRRTLRVIANGLGGVGRVLGLFLEKPQDVLARIDKRRQAQRGITAEVVEDLIAKRNAARKAKNFAEADAIRQKLAHMGVEIKDSPTGTTWQAR